MAIFRVEAAPPSRRNWGVTVQVERVKAGKYTDPTFTFRVHSPARAGLEVGVRYTIEATWNAPSIASARDLEGDVLPTS